MMAAVPFRPRSRKDIKIAIICALPFEAETVQSAFDREWPYDYGKSPGDTNTYCIGAMGQHNVVLVCMPNMGTSSATATAINLCASFPNLKFGFLVGICGAVPSIGLEEVVLGDCLISTHVIQYDFGRQHENKFIRKKSMEDNLGRANIEIRSLLATLVQSANRQKLTERLLHHLSAYQATNQNGKAIYPGTKHDQLFEPSYIHRHNLLHGSCECLDDPGLCAKDCETIGCESDRLVTRKRLCSNDGSERLPRIHFTRFGSANMVMRSGRYRDEIAKEENISAFDMESSGIWDHVPTIVIKSASDYADSHKNKIWQGYAATTATAGLKAVLEQIQILDYGHPIKMLPFTRDTHFTAREDILATLWSNFDSRIPQYQMRKALVGMGGVGKTQIAIEYAYRLLKSDPRHSIFWIHASNTSRFEEGYREIANHAKIPISNASNVLPDIMNWLSDEHNGEWTMILDNVDDDKVFTVIRPDGKRLRDFLPTNDHGSILITSRSEIAAINLVGLNNSISVNPMTTNDSLKLLNRKMDISESNQLAARELVEKLECLPLAIVHASAYMLVRKMSLARYNVLFQKERNQTQLLAFDQYQDLHRDASAERAVLTTWHISFSTLESENPGAASSLSLLSMFDNASIPVILLGDKSLQPEEDDLQLEDCIGILLNYSLISVAEGTSLSTHSIKIHRMVQLAMRRWLEEHMKLSFYQKEAVTTLSAVLPLSESNVKDMRLASELVSHAKQIMKYPMENHDQPTLLSKIGALFYICNLPTETEEALSRTISLKKQRTSTQILDLIEDIVMYVTTLRVLNRNEECQRICQEAIQDCENTGIQNSAYYDARRLLCRTLSSAGHVKEAETQLLGMLELQLNDPIVAAVNIIKTMMTLATIYSYQGKDKQALATSCKCYGKAQETLDPDHIDVLKSMNNYGLYLARVGRHEESQALLSKCFAKCKDVLGYKNDLTWCVADSLAESYQRQKKFSQAENLFRETIDKMVEALGPHYRTTLLVTNNLVNCLFDQGKLTEAEALSRATVLLMQTHIGKESYHTLNSMTMLGKILYRQEDLVQAETFLQQALTYYTASAGVEAPITLETAVYLHKTLEGLNRKQEAEALRKIYNLPDPDEKPSPVDANYTAKPGRSICAGGYKPYW